jgi:hypothetical protein
MTMVFVAALAGSAIERWMMRKTGHPHLWALYKARRSR